MATARKYQTTTVRMPKHVFETAKRIAVRHEASSFNEFVIQAIEEKIRRLSEAAIDASFAQMATDPDYQRDATGLAREFESSDWEALQSSDHHELPKAGAAKTRTR
jgi:hypothetical protein